VDDELQLHQNRCRLRVIVSLLRLGNIEGLIEIGISVSSATWLRIYLGRVRSLSVVVKVRLELCRVGVRGRDTRRRFGSSISLSPDSVSDLVLGCALRHLRIRAASDAVRLFGASVSYRVSVWSISDARDQRADDDGLALCASYHRHFDSVRFGCGSSRSVSWRVLSSSEGSSERLRPARRAWRSSYGLLTPREERRIPVSVVLVYSIRANMADFIIGE